LALSFPASEKRNHTPILVEGFLTTPVKLLEDGTTTSQEVVRPTIHEPVLNSQAGRREPLQRI
jgi:hypothetical protein